MISLQNKALIQSIEAELKYCFRDKNLLIQAFTRSSYHKQNPEAPHNEVLEFLGDSLLDYYVTDYFVTEYAVKKTSGYFSGQDEGALTKLRSHYTCNDYLRDRCRRWNISKHLRTVDKKELQNEKIDADLLESLIGAIYLDSGKNEKTTREFILRVLNLNSHVPEEPATNPTPVKVTAPAKTASPAPKAATSMTAQTQLAALCKQRNYSAPVYTQLQPQQGKPFYACTVKELKTDGHRCASADSNEAAKEKAASALLKHLQKFSPTTQKAVATKKTVAKPKPQTTLPQATEQNAQGLLSMYCQKNKLSPPRYVNQKGSAKQGFTVTCQFKGVAVQGKGKTENQARRQAALALLCDHLKIARR